MNVILALPNYALLYDLTVATPFPLTEKDVGVYPIYFKAVKKVLNENAAVNINTLLKSDFVFPLKNGIISLTITSYKHATHKVYLNRPNTIEAAENLLRKTNVDLVSNLLPLRTKLKAFINNSTPFTVKVHRLIANTDVQTLYSLGKNAVALFVHQNGVRFYLPEDFPISTQETKMLHKSEHTALSSFFFDEDRQQPHAMFEPLNDIKYYHLQQQYFNTLYEGIKAAWNREGFVG